MRMSAKETDLVRACLDWLALHRVMAWRMNNTGIFDPVKRVFRSFRGMKGVSDILGILPVSVETGARRERIGTFLAVETKRPGEKLREEQEAFLAAVSERGGVGLCVHSLDELDAGVRRYL